MANKEPEPQPLPIILMDDHENEYEGELTIDLALKEISTDILRVVPKGFSYVDTVIISMPKVAPIEKVRLGEKEWKFSEIKFGEPQYLRDFGDAAVAKGEKMQVGNWLSFTMGNIESALRHWELLIDIENKEYNPLSAVVQAGIQLRDMVPFRGRVLIQLRCRERPNL